VKKYKITNKYKQVPVAREEEPEPAWQPTNACHVAKGDRVNCSFKPLFFTIAPGTTVADVTPSKAFASGWGIVVKDTDGVSRHLDSSFFKKA